MVSQGSAVEMLLHLHKSSLWLSNLWLTVHFQIVLFNQQLRVKDIQLTVFHSEDKLHNISMEKLFGFLLEKWLNCKNGCYLLTDEGQNVNPVTARCFKGRGGQSADHEPQSPQCKFSQGPSFHSFYVSFSHFLSTFS